MKRGIILLNLGGPHKLEDVKPFLYNLFSDPDILVGIPAPFRQALALLISRVKGPSSIETYKLIGGGSPQLKWSNAQAAHLGVELNRAQPRDEWKVLVGMRAWNPTIGDALGELQAWGADEVIALPLFPHFSTTTTGSCFKEIRRLLKKRRWQPVLTEVHEWPDHADYIRLLRETVDEAVARAEQEGPVHVLFSAHSLPMKIIERGDPYPRHIERTVAALSQGLAQPWSLAFQSRNGKADWLQPYTEDELARLGRAGVKRIVVVPVSFVSDHIETLYELDLLYADHARKHGIESYHRSRVFNDDPRFGLVLADLALRG
jgi:ferrochelatase